MGLNYYAHKRRRCIYFIYLPVPSTAPLTPFPHLFWLILPFLYVLFSPFLSALSVLLRSAHHDVFLCIDPASLLLFSKLFSFPFKFLLTHHLVSMGSISPIHRSIFLCYSLLYALLFSLHLCRRSTLFFS